MDKPKLDIAIIKADKEKIIKQGQTVNK